MAGVAKVFRVGHLELVHDLGSKYLYIKPVGEPKGGPGGAVVLDIREMDALRDYLTQIYTDLFELERDESKAKQAEEATS